MSSYVASARIVGAAPRLARVSRAMDASDRAAAAEPADILIIDAANGTDHGPILAECRDAFRERWSQLTFFLFDANSWRS